ncbi:precorrin-3B synthase [Rhodococcus sp. (in: high G+C Gram-positive bacteria)]|uniref:precorrin-3B synthase n=1 Tax=Rhodococcus sp. TaxID=1831 RepID=UPI0019E9A4A5|nr:precorrin-3B synthase [Rhodococcus sp. (in: high G+C Gram-positive bacteria)]MBF0660814.1 precorrin-3B synthase [Rhodococcus sp. (in: high G+C Gram-positive bacteria)]
MSDAEVEVHLSGGVVTAAQLRALAELAESHGGGELHLTERAQILLRGDPEPITSRLSAIGLTVDAPTRPRVLASPLSGRLEGHRDIRPLVRAVAARLHASPDRAARIYGIDDGTGDIVALAPHVAVLARPDGRMALVRDGIDTGLRIDPDTAAEILLAGTPPSGEPDAAEPLPSPPPAPIGWLDQTDGAVTLAGGLPGGVLPARLAEFLAAVERPVVITPWRSVLLCDLDEWTAEQVVRVLAPMGLVFDARSPQLD